MNHDEDSEDLKSSLKFQSHSNDKLPDWLLDIHIQSGISYWE